MMRYKLSRTSASGSEYHLDAVGAQHVSSTTFTPVKLTNAPPEERSDRLWTMHFPPGAPDGEVVIYDPNTASQEPTEIPRVLFIDDGTTPPAVGVFQHVAADSQRWQLEAVQAQGTSNLSSLKVRVSMLVGTTRYYLTAANVSESAAVTLSTTASADTEWDLSPFTPFPQQSNYLESMPDSSAPENVGTVISTLWSGLAALPPSESSAWNRSLASELVFWLYHAPSYWSTTTELNTRLTNDLYGRIYVPYWVDNPPTPGWGINPPTPPSILPPNPPHGPPN